MIKWLWKLRGLCLVLAAGGVVAGAGQVDAPGEVEGRVLDGGGCDHAVGGQRPVPGRAPHVRPPHEVVVVDVRLGLVVRLQVVGLLLQPVAEVRVRRQPVRPVKMLA